MMYEAELDIADLRSAADDIAVVKKMLPPTPVVLNLELAVHNRMLKLTGASDADMQNWRQIAEAAAHNLTQFPDYPFGRVARLDYFRVTGQNELASRELQVLRNMGFGGNCIKAIELYRDKKYEQSIAVWENEPYGYASVGLAIVQADLDRETALETIRDVFEDGESQEFARREAVGVLMLLGEDMNTLDLK